MSASGGRRGCVTGAFGVGLSRYGGGWGGAKRGTSALVLEKIGVDGAKKKPLKSGLYLYKGSRAGQNYNITSRHWLHHFPFVRNSYAVAVGLHNLVGHYGLLEKTLVTFHSHNAMADVQKSV